MELNTFELLRDQSTSLQAFTIIFFPASAGAARYVGVNGQRESWFVVMIVRYKFPPARLTQRVTPDLVDVSSDLQKDHGFGYDRMNYNSGVPMPVEVNGFCDGHRLYVHSSKDIKFLSWSILLYIIAFLSFAFVLGTYGIDDPYYSIYISVFIVSLSIGLVISYRNSRLAFSKFIVFDRDTGLVLFSGRGRWPDFTVPFEKVECYTFTSVLKGGAHFNSGIMPLTKPRGIRGKWRDKFMLGFVNNEIETLQQWCFVHRFMDKSQPIPIEAYRTWVHIQWFQRQHLTIDKMMQKKGVVEADKDTGWFIWPDGEPPPSYEEIEAAQRRGSYAGREGPSI